MNGFSKRLYRLNKLSSIPGRADLSLTAACLLLLATALPSLAQPLEPQTSSLTLQRPKSSLHSISDFCNELQEFDDASPDSKSNPWHQAEIEAIQRIRSQLGSSAVGSLSQLLGDPQEAERQFAEELAKVYRNQELHTQAPTADKKSTNGNQSNQRLRPLPGSEPARPSNLEEHPSLARQNRPRSKRLIPRPEMLQSIESIESQSVFDSPTQGPVKSFEVTTNPSHPVRLTNPFSNQPVTANPVQRTKISAVRNVAVQLEQAAAELEHLQLYDDADLLRSTADGMWKRARQIESESSSSVNARAEMTEPTCLKR